MFNRRNPTQEEIDALERAADAAYEEGDKEHEKSLRQAALYKRRVMRERKSGWSGTPVAAYIDKI